MRGPICASLLVFADREQVGLGPAGPDDSFQDLSAVLPADNEMRTPQVTGLGQGCGKRPQTLEALSHLQDLLRVEQPAPYQQTGIEKLVNLVIREAQV